MGYGFPAAIGAKLGNPHKDVIVISGDGGMQMNIQEMATAVVYELPIIICILNNGYLGNVRQWQEMFYDRRYSSTCMRYRKSCEIGCNTPNHCCPEYTPDFIRLAESYGATAIGVEALDQTLDLVLAGRVDATLNADVSFYDYMKVHPDADLKIVALTEESSPVVIPVRKGKDSEAFLEKVNQAIEELRASGELGEISMKYFDVDISKE